MGFQDVMKLVGSFHAANGVFELRIDPVADVNQGLFHALNVAEGIERRGFFGQFVGKLVDIR